MRSMARGFPTCRKHPQRGSALARDLPTHGPPWLWARADAAEGGGEGVSHKPPCDLFNQSVPPRNSV